MTKTNKVLNVIWDYFLISFGTLLYCMAWCSFLIPNGISAGGLTGACTILQFATNGAIPVANSFFVMNVILLIMGVMVLGNAFGLKTVYSILLSSLLLKVLPDYHFLEATQGNFLFIDNKLLIPVVGGLIEAVGVGIIFSHGGSTGGTDVIALIINKYWPLSPGKVYLYTDLFIIASILLVPGKSFQDMIYGYITMITFSTMLDFVLMGSKSTVQVLVFSDKSNELADHIMKNLNRGVTALKSIGCYTGKEKDVLLVIVRKSQISQLSKVIKEVDTKALVSVAPASSVYGEGFDELKTGVVRKKGKNQSLTEKQA